MTKITGFFISLCIYIYMLCSISAGEIGRGILCCSIRSKGLSKMLDLKHKLSFKWITVTYTMTVLTPSVNTVSTFLTLPVASYSSVLLRNL